MSIFYTSPPVVVDGDVAFAKDVNDINSETNSGFNAVESALGGLEISVQQWAELAEKWAEEAEDTEVEPGAYSAFHWATKGSASASSASSSASAASSSASTASSAASSASTSETNADADATQTALDVIQTGSDATDTAADRVQTGLDVISTNADVVTTNADAATTTQDAIDTAANAASTAQDAIDTAADLVATNQDTIDTAADRVQTGLDASSASTSETNAATSAAEAAASAALIDLPTVTSADIGKSLTILPDLEYSYESTQRKNYIVDGDFNFWYEGTSQTSDGYGSDTMWDNEHSGSTKTHTRQEFPIGHSDVPGNPKYYSRTVVVEDSATSSLTIKGQKLEDVTKLSGKTVTLSFWARTNVPLNISTELSQDFGTGGSPSATVTGIGVSKHPITTAWAKYTATIAIPSVSGKTLGTDGNDYLRLIFWFDAGTDWDLRTDSLGHQSGTFDIARVHLVEGSIDGDDIDESYGEVLEKVNRYFARGAASGHYGYQWAGSSNVYHGATMTHRVLMRGIPVVTEFSAPDYTNCTFASFVLRPDVTELRVTTTAIGIYRVIGGLYHIDARL